MDSHSRRLILASASPRRRELLLQLGLSFDVAPAHIDETVKPGEAPQDYVARMALEKAAAGARASSPHTVVLGADTAVVAGARILGKPPDKATAIEMLALLSDSTHTVLSGIALTDGSRTEQALSATRVTFGHITPAAAAAYWETGEPADKAGGYAIQGLGAVFVREIAGSYSGVVGLPLFETAAMLRLFGFEAGIISV